MKVMRSPHSNKFSRILEVIMLRRILFIQVYFVIIPVILFFIGCGTPLPIAEMAKAKQEIARASVLKADEFAKTEYDEARKGLFNAHNFAADEKPDPAEAKSAAEYAVARAYDAIEKTLPKLSSKTRDEASRAIDAADVAFAVQLAADDFNKSVDLRKEGDGLSQDGEKQLFDYPKESDDDKKLNLRLRGFDTYEKAYRKYEESRELAERAKNLALSQKQQMLDSISDIEDNLATAEKYSEGNDPRIARTRALLDDAKSNINDGKIKDGYNKLETARKESQEIVAASVKSYAAKKKEEAKNKIADTEEAISSLPQDKISANPQAKSSFQTATENVEAAKEALKSAEELYDQEKYQDSIKQSEEAIRLADIVVEQKDSLMAMLNKAPANTRSADIDGDDSDSSENSKAPGEGWKTYIVRKKVPSDCLWRIAGYKEHYGNPRLWTRIYKANKAKIKNPDLIYPKQKFDIPPKKGSLKKPKKSVNKPEEKRDKDLADTPKNSNGEESDDSLDSSSGDEESPKNN